VFIVTNWVKRQSLFSLFRVFIIWCFFIFVVIFLYLVYSFWCYILFIFWAQVSENCKYRHKVVINQTSQKRLKSIKKYFFVVVQWLVAYSQKLAFITDNASLSEFDLHVMSHSKALFLVYKPFFSKILVLGGWDSAVVRYKRLDKVSV
jgi:hypothetical protein